MKKFLVLCTFVLVVGCASSTQTARQVVAGMATVYATASLSFETYARLPRCSAQVPQPCSEAAKVVEIGPKLLLARDAVDTARKFVNTLPEDAPVATLTADQRAMLDTAAQVVGAANTAIQGVK